MSTKKLKKTKAVAVIEPQEIRPHTLIAQAITQGVPVETLEKLMDLQDRYDAKQARKAFDQAMSDFQMECPVIKKTTPGGETNAGKVAYKYATLDQIVTQTKALIKAHGFSYAIKTESTNDSIKAICIVKHVAGHQEESDFKVPSTGGTSIMSGPQKVAAALTFAKRYAFCDAFGIITGDADPDASKKTVEPEAPKKPAVMPTLLTLYQRSEKYIAEETDHAKLKGALDRIEKTAELTDAEKFRLKKKIETKLNA